MCWLDSDSMFCCIDSRCRGHKIDVSLTSKTSMFQSFSTPTAAALENVKCRRKMPKLLKLS